MSWWWEHGMTWLRTHVLFVMKKIRLSVLEPLVGYWPNRALLLRSRHTNWRQLLFFTTNELIVMFLKCGKIDFMEMSILMVFCRTFFNGMFLLCVHAFFAKSQAGHGNEVLPASIRWWRLCLSLVWYGAGLLLIYSITVFLTLLFIIILFLSFNETGRV